MSVKHVVLRKVAKKVLSVLMATILLSGYVLVTGCDDGGKEVSKDAGKIVKPEKITVQIGNDMIEDGPEADKFEEYLERLLSAYGDEGNIDIEFIRPEDSAYYDEYSSVGCMNERADVRLYSQKFYQIYASSGMFWDMTSAWEETKTKIADRLTEGSQDFIDTFYELGADGKKAVYGVAQNRGAGCCTYIKADWLKNAGIDKSSIEGKTLTFDEYYDILKKMKAASKSDYVISPVVYVEDEAPYTHYLPEFYQDAHFDFYKDESGKYVDGFSEQSMIDALTRIQTAVNDGIINKNIANKPKEARDLFCTPDMKKESGVITYWAGSWAQTFSEKLEGKKRTDGTTMSGELVAIKPIAELGQYVERNVGIWAISSECQNPEGVYKYFIEPMFTGGDIQLAWQYGVKGVHWDDNTEEIQINHIDPIIAIAPIENDPGISKISAIKKESRAFFSNNSRICEKLPMTEALATHMTDINKTRREIVYKVVIDPSYSAKQGIEDYKALMGKSVKEVLKSLNELEG